ncbi:MAG: saccharopine dehydrogenase family protein [Candidatus Hydrogenedentota bacterium]
MNDNGTWLIYGAYGYTGALLTRYAVAHGHRPILAGRHAGKLEALAAAHGGLETRPFDLSNRETIDTALEGVTVVAHCAGPFQRTCAPMMKACLRMGTHYLDITGEVDVFELCAAADKRAKAAGVMVMPGAGFDVVPSDCLAAHVNSRLPEASHLTLAFMTTGRPSHGTATTIAENLPRGLVVREEGKLARKPAGWKQRTIDFGEGPVKTITIPWGDVSTAYRSTGIPNIAVYMAAPYALRLFTRASRHMKKLLASGRVQRFLKRRIDAAPPGPSDEQRAKQYAKLWGEAVDENGHRVVSRLHTPDTYTVTVLTTLSAVEKVLAGNAPPGYQTPATAYGADFILEIEGCEREDL